MLAHTPTATAGPGAPCGWPASSGWRSRRWCTSSCCGPLLDLDGLSYVCDKLLHMVSPAMVLIGWFVFGPRPRVTSREIGWSLGWVALWTAWTLVVGAVTGWFPYPFMDFDDKGWGAVLVALVASLCCSWPSSPRPPGSTVAWPRAAGHRVSGQVLGDLAPRAVDHRRGAGCAVDQRQPRRHVAALHVEHDGDVEVAERVLDRLVLGHRLRSGAWVRPTSTASACSNHPAYRTRAAAGRS